MGVSRAAASARLCVETMANNNAAPVLAAAASARLCVETMIMTADVALKMRSRLRAAVC